MTPDIGPAIKPYLPIRLRVNGTGHDLKLDSRVSVLDALRDHLNLTGTKKGCDQGACGACTILVDGERVLSCLALAVQYDGCDIITVEGLGATDIGRALQKAFVEEDGFQCGYCTPGQLCSAAGMLNEVRRGIPSAVTGPTSEVSMGPEELSERMSGNLCRCGAYIGIRRAIEAAYERTANEEAR